MVISAIGGTAGVGKTALAVHWAHQIRQRFPDGQLYVNLRGYDPAGSALEPATAIRGFLDALGVPPQRLPTDQEALTALYRSELAGRRMLIVLDNARDSAQVRPLLPGTPGCLVLVTSRNDLSGLVTTHDARAVALTMLSHAEARELLAHRLGSDRITAEPDAVDDLIGDCARLPLALSIVAARAANHPHLPLRALVAQLRDEGGRLDALTTDDPATDARAVFSWSYQALATDAARLFRLLGLHPGPDFAAPAAASLAGLDLPRVRALLAELTRANLLMEILPGRYAFHDLLRAYAAEQARATDPDDQRHAAVHRMLDHYVHTACASARLLNPTRDPITLTPPRPGVTPEHVADLKQALRWFTAEHAVLLAVVDHAAATGFDVHTWQLAWALTDYFYRQGYWDHQVTTQCAAIDAAARLDDPITQARARNNLANAYAQLGQLDEALAQLEEALDLVNDAEFPTGQAYVEYSLGDVLYLQGRYAQAVEHSRRAMRLYEAIGNQIGLGRALSLTGSGYSRLGDNQLALATCQQALAKLLELNDTIGLADTWHVLGRIHDDLGQSAEAITSYQRAVDLYRDTGNLYKEAEVLIHSGDTHEAAGDHRAARETWQRAVIILDQLRHPDADKVRVKLGVLGRDEP